MGKKEHLNKISTAVVYVNTTQIVLIIAFLIYLFWGMAPNSSQLGAKETVVFLFVILASVGINYYLTFKYIKSMLHNSRYYAVLQETNVQLETMNNTLRSQRHDFMNHLQVVYSLMELKDHHEAMDYIEKVYGDIQKVNRALRTSIPAVNALIQAKLISAEKSGIIVRIHITTPLEKLIIPAWEFCRILGNLIDNSLYALQTMEEWQFRELCIELTEDLKSYCFRIRNNGPEIPESIRNHIFESGFTTKKDKGEGMGLSITKEIMQQYRGKLQVISNQEFTEFTGVIPKSVEHTE